MGWGPRWCGDGCWSTIRISWRVACGLWVTLPLIAWGFPSLFWWTMASLLVVAVGLTQPQRQVTAVFGWGLLGCLAVYLIHRTQPYGSQALWMTHVTIGLMAAALMAERAEWRWLRQAVVWCAWGQLPVMAFQAFGHSLWWESVGGGLTGTMGYRAACAALLALASLWSSGWRAWSFAAAACLTGSWMGLPAVGRLVWGLWPSHLAWGFLSLALLALTSEWWMPRLALRLEAWQGFPLLHGGWLTGWGFLPLPGGFAYDAGTFASGGAKAAPFVISDYHSAFVDWIARTGLVGVVMLLALGRWVCTRLTSSAHRWAAGLAVWVGCWQSVETMTVLALLLVVWWIGLAQGGRDVDSLHAA